MKFEGTGRSPSLDDRLSVREKVLGDCSTTDGSSRVTERHRHKAGSVTRLHPHQDIVLALVLRFDQCLADIAGVCDGFAADIEDNVAGLEALVGGRPVRIDSCNHDWKRAFEVYSPSAMCGLGQSSGWARQSARGQ